MREIRASSALTVYHDGQFWVGLFECVEDGRLSVCRVVFGAEPSAEELLQLVCGGWGSLRFTQPVDSEQISAIAANPKRRQREAARELRRRGPSTKAQQALSEEREALAQKHKTDERARRNQERQERFERRQQKRRQRHRGR